MKSIYLLFVIGLLSSPLQMLAKKVDGKILFENDTIDVVFEIPTLLFSKKPDYLELQSRVRYVDADGKTRVLNPEKAKEIQFKMGDENVRMLSRVNTLESGIFFSHNRRIFMKLENDGPLKLFRYYFRVNNPGYMNPSMGGMPMGISSSVKESYVLQKGESVLKKPKFLTFKKDMTGYLSDCPSVADKIGSKDFRYDDIRSIVEFYNTDCGKP